MKGVKRDLILICMMMVIGIAGLVMIKAGVTLFITFDFEAIKRGSILWICGGIFLCIAYEMFKYLFKKLFFS